MGQRWKRSPRDCPPWCAKDHTCTAKDDYPSGQHRSRPVTIRAVYGTLVCTRVQSLGGRGRMEIRLTADLSGEDRVAHWQAQHLAAGVDLTVRAVLSGVPVEDWLGAQIIRQPQLPAPRRPRPSP
jgi:hypothetical protein